ncbi:serine/threonine-protein kinase [Actinomadura hibisca]|uniref:serine/threonine-protein kinase n=1 Tax=Actinomadura hibisca TaxID=68565 RepID=UPI00082AA6F9|nr:serine/threonine-protein kinase [Actinomadura hibisca]
MSDTTREWRIAGFRELRELGSGAFGRVVLAEREGTGHLVAIKYLRAAKPGDIDALRREAELLGQVQSPYVVRLYRFETDAEHARAAIVMEAVNGVSLQRVLQEHGRLSPEAALTVLKGSLLGLHAAHALGVVHRDYKPANVLVQPDGLSKLADFGIAVHAGQDGGAGTPLYMAPEQWERQPAGPATDVYAATCVFYQCLTGRPPFEAKGTVALSRAHLHDPVPLEDVPEKLRPLVEGGLAKSAWGRPPTAQDFVNALETLARDAYGKQWERRGVKALAAGTAVLAASLPVALLGGGGAGAAGSAGAAGAAGASGAAGAGGASGGGGLLASAGGAKVVAGVTAGAIAVGGGGFAAYQATRPEPRRVPAARTQPVSATVALTRAPFRDTTTGLFSNDASVVQVGGIKDAALRARVNKALRAPLDGYMAEMRAIYDSFGPQGQPTQRKMNQESPAKVKTRIGIRGPRYVSVAYDMASTILAGGGKIQTIRTITVDLTTGRTLTAKDLFPAERLAAGGLAAFAKIPKPRAIRTMQPPDCRARMDKLDRPRRNATGPASAEHVTTRLLLTRKGAEFVFGEGDAGECAGVAWTVLPFADVGGLLRPDVVKIAQTSA